MTNGAPGVVTGLAWTSLGGATLQIEATGTPSKSHGFKQTGQLGNVMVESSEIAYSYVMSHLSKYGARKDFFDEHFVHLHVPAGATPKDGPSAGITMAAALISMLKGQAVLPGLAMTGELTLTGRVLAIGGLKEKVIAACVACVTADKKISVKEAELLRVITELLECPLPPLLPTSD